jgi:hypothetical protein
MSCNLTPNQKHRIATKFQSSKYRSPEEVLEVALGLLDAIVIPCQMPLNSDAHKLSAKEFWKKWELRL